jgi:hypothetical protein
MMAPNEQPWHDYDYAFVRVVPRVHLGTFVNVGVVLHARTAGFLGVRLHRDAGRIAALCPERLDYEILAHHLEAYERVSRGGPGAGPIGLLPASERFHWLTAPRSAVLQTSEIHAGRTADPEATLEHLYRTYVLL